MTHVNDLVSTETAGRQPSPGFLLAPFGWAAEPLAAMLHAEPSLLPDLFGISRPRMHLIALALAHLDQPVPPGVGCLLARGPARQVLGRVLGGCPAGIKRALDHLPGAVLQRQNYRRLVHLLADPGGATVLHHAATINDLAIQVLGDLPPPLRRPFASALADWPEKLNGLTAGLQFLVSRGVAATVDELVAELARVTAWPQLAAMVEAWVGRLPLPETMPPATVGSGRRDRVDEICCLGRAWQNCLRSYGSAIDAGRSAVYLWDEAGRPAACLVERHGRLGWFLDQVKGPANIDVEPEQLQLIGAAFAGVGVPGSRVVAAIETIIFESSFSSDSGPPLSMEEA
jgi:hypothetical protein